MPRHNHEAVSPADNATGTLNTNGWFENGVGTASGVFTKGSSNSYEGRGGGGSSRVITFRHNHTHNISLEYTGTSNAHANMQPYYTVYMWHRIA